MNFKVTKLEIPDVLLIEHTSYPDERGWFMELWNEDSFKGLNIDNRFIQANISRSRYGTLRGLHFQKPPFEQAKFVRCIQGEIFDVAVDIRRDSKTFRKYVSATLSGENFKSLFIPRGFAHGFLVTSKEDAIVEYMVDNKYSKENESGIRWDALQINIRWPFTPLIVSHKDSELHDLL
ncbi:dTDP-4-dehydrorhamnose 3,5-epimerase [mine drainage metagenome]|uniref:dTDP-4-dehydrorhamnose 3,5-epimerase n=1 Tax=mine drainage metagenome TaxID=410659 RepID=T0YSJ1_9ZZZZ